MRTYLAGQKNVVLFIALAGAEETALRSSTAVSAQGWEMHQCPPCTSQPH